LYYTTKPAKDKAFPQSPLARKWNAGQLHRPAFPRLERFQSGCSSGSAGLQARVKSARTIHWLQPLRSLTSAAEAIFLLALGRGPEGPHLPERADTPILEPR